MLGLNRPVSALGGVGLAREGCSGSSVGVWVRVKAGKSSEPSRS